MVVCNNCGSTVQEGKFYEKCVKPFVANNEIDASRVTIKSSNVASGFLNKISSSVNNVETDLFVIHSDLINGNIIYKVNKVSNVQDKKIIIVDNELVYFDATNGFEKN